MAIDPSVNKILKRMWFIDEQINASPNSITNEEHKFYNENLNLIKSYYYDNTIYWLQKKKLFK